MHATHGDDLPRSLRIYAFGAALGGQRVLDAARALAEQSRIPRSHLTLVDRHATYAHNDPGAADPDNDFIDSLMPFLAQVDGKASKQSGNDDGDYTDPAAAGARSLAGHR